MKEWICKEKKKNIGLQRCADYMYKTKWILHFGKCKSKLNFRKTRPKESLWTLSNLNFRPRRCGLLCI